MTIISTPDFSRLGAAGAFSARVSWQGFGYSLGGALNCRKAAITSGTDARPARYVRVVGDKFPRLFSEVREGVFAGTLRHPVTKRLIFFSGVYRPLSGGIGTFSGPDHMGSVGRLGFD